MLRVCEVGHFTASKWANLEYQNHRVVRIKHEAGLDHLYWDKNGEISPKHGNTLISTLRQL
jgi:hypothetical protein